MAKKEVEQVLSPHIDHHQLNTTPNVRWKGHQGFRHDLFKLEVEKMKKNVSYQKKLPQILNVEHTHLFHSHDNKGQANQYCVPVGGHFHEIKTSVNAMGNIVATCGPALRKAEKRLANGRIRSIVEPLRWAKQVVTSDDVMETFEIDSHTHDITYISSEELTQSKLSDIQKANASGLAAMNVQAPRMQEIKAPEGVSVQEQDR